MFKINEGWSQDVNCNIGVKKGCPLSLTLFGIYIVKKEFRLEEVARIVVNLLYVDDIVIMEMCPSNLDKKLRILKYF